MDEEFVKVHPFIDAGDERFIELRGTYIIK
jgi:hypothetical protein